MSLLYYAISESMGNLASLDRLEHRLDSQNREAGDKGRIEINVLNSGKLKELKKKCRKTVGSKTMRLDRSSFCFILPKTRLKSPVHILEFEKDQWESFI